MLLLYINLGDRNPPYPALGSNIPSARRRGLNGFTFFNARGLCRVNRHGGTLRRAGWVAFTKTYSRGKWLKSHLPLTFAIIIHIPRPLHPCIWCPCVPIPTSPRPILDVLKSLVSRPQVPSPHTCVPMSPSPCPRPTFIHSRPQWTCRVDFCIASNTDSMLVEKQLHLDFWKPG